MIIMKIIKSHTFQFIIFVILVLFLNVTHEIGHTISAYLVDAKVEEIEIFPKPHIIVKTEDKQKLKYILPAGSLLNAIFAALLILLGKRKKLYGIYSAGISILQIEMSSWNLFTPLKHGDAVDF